MDLEHDAKTIGAGKNAKHISMELVADGARVTNLSLKGSKLVLTIEAELAESQVNAGPETQAASARPAREGSEAITADLSESRLTGNHEAAIGFESEESGNAKEDSSETQYVFHSGQSGQITVREEDAPSLQAPVGASESLAMPGPDHAAPAPTQREESSQFHKQARPISLEPDTQEEVTAGPIPDFAGAPAPRQSRRLTPPAPAAHIALGAAPEPQPPHTLAPLSIEDGESPQSPLELGPAFDEPLSAERAAPPALEPQAEPDQGPELQFDLNFTPSFQNAQPAPKAPAPPAPKVAAPPAPEPAAPLSLGDIGFAPPIQAEAPHGNEAPTLSLGDAGAPPAPFRQPVAPTLEPVSGPAPSQGAPSIGLAPQQPSGPSLEMPAQPPLEPLPGPAAVSPRQQWGENSNPPAADNRASDWGQPTPPAPGVSPAPAPAASQWDVAPQAPQPPRPPVSRWDQGGPAMAEESSVMGGERHGEPQPAMSYGVGPAAKPAPEPPLPPAADRKTQEPGGTTVLIRYTCPKCKTQGMQAVDKVGTVVNCSNCGKAMRLVMKK